MANYPNIMRLRPEVREFVRHRNWIHRGDVLTYQSDVRCDAFSTDGAGFRHSVFNGETLSVRDCRQHRRYGLVLGSSHVYGFGLAGNENTIPSLLAQRFGFPFGNVGLPEASSRNLYALLLGYIVRSPHPPAIVVYLSGGDFTDFSFSHISDPVFGSPNLKQILPVLEERGGRPRAEKQFEALLAFNSLWSRGIAQLCQAQEIPLVMGNDTTFFEKREPNATEIESELGHGHTPSQQQLFFTHKEFFPAFLDHRSALAASLGLSLAGSGRNNDLSFIDEFHYDREGTRTLCDDFAAAIDPLL